MPRRRNPSGKDDSRRNFLKASGAGAVALSLAGCSGGGGNDTSSTTDDGPRGTGTTTASENTIGPDQIERGGTLRYGMATNPDTSNIMTSGSVYAAVGWYPVYDFGLTQDPITFEFHEGVFTDWTIENTDSEKPDIYANVRTEGLEWNDGEKFKPMEDVLFSYQFLLDNEPGEWTAWKDYEVVEEASNDWDIHIKMSNQVGTWESALLASVPIIPQHIWSNVAWEEYAPHEERDEGPVGTGPAKLVKFKPDTSMQLKTRTDYVENTYALNKLDWKKEHSSIIHGGPFLDGVNFKIYGGKNPKTQAFLNGDIDTHYGTLDTSKIPKARKQSGIGLIKAFDSGFSYFGYNLRRAPLDDVSLRQAMAFAWDEKFWTKSLKGGYVIDGDYAQPPGYRAVRPETVHDAKLLEAPETNMFTFRRKSGKTVDKQAIRDFLTSGKVIGADGGTFAGKEVPGTFSGVGASRSSAKHDYSFGEPVSEAIREQDGADKEIRVNGNTIPEMMDGDAITLLMDPPGDKPNEAKALQQWAKNLRLVGIPVKTTPIEFNAMSERVYNTEQFDIYPMGWGGWNSFGLSIEAIFHSRNAGNDTEVFSANAMNYGNTGGSADDLIEDAYSTYDTKPRNKKWAKALERIYLDQPYMLMDYAKYRWPMNTAKFGGYIEGIVDPGYATWTDQFNNIYLKDNVEE